MALGIYIFTWLAGVGTVMGVIDALGCRPTPRRLRIAFFASLLLAALHVILTVILSREGNRSHIPLLVGLGSWALLAAVRPLSRAVLLSGGLFLYSLLLAFQHWHLANSQHYTDNPSARQFRVRSMRVAATRSGRPLPSDVTIHPALHTWVTALYVVDARPLKAAPSGE